MATITRALDQANSDRDVARKPSSRVRARLLQNRFALAGLILIVLVICLALLAPFLTSYHPDAIEPRARLDPPSAAHPLGTDSFGRDVWSRLLFGSRVSLAVGLSAVALLSTVGVLVGAVSAFWGGGTDQAIMRVVDLLLSVPQFFLLLLIVALVGPSTIATVLVIGLTSWMGMARLVRGQVLALKHQDFVLAARAMGGSGWRLLMRHLLPNCLGIIIVNATLWVAIAIVLESSLSYLGLGAQPPTSTWGNMLTEGRRYMREAWWIIAFPGLAIFITAMSFNLMGDGLRDALDPRSRSRKV